MTQIQARTVACIIPTHGRPEFLSEALESVLAQTVAPTEIIVVSDDNDQRTIEVVEQLSLSSAVPIRYLANASGSTGASSSRNEGARAASSDYLAFLDDDDKWLPTYLEHSLETLVNGGAEASVTWLTMFRGELESPGLMIRDGLAARQVAAINPGFTGSNFVVAAPAFWAIDGFDANLKVINDGDFIYRYLSAGHSYKTNERFEVLQRRHSEGQLTTATEMRARGLEAYMVKHRLTLSLSDRRYMRLAINRIRYHAVTPKAAKLRYLVAGLLNSSPLSVAISLRSWKQRPLWRAQKTAKSSAHAPV